MRTRLWRRRPSHRALRPDEVRAIEKLPLDEALRLYVALLTGEEGKRLDALLLRVAWGSNPPLTLRAAAARAGFSPEWMRRLELDLRRRASKNRVSVEALGRAYELLGRTRDLDADEVARKLAAEGMTIAPLHPSNIGPAAELFGYTKDRRPR